MKTTRAARRSMVRVEKPWGWELVWAEAEDYVGKLLFVRAGESLSLQYHEVKDESWLVQEGRAELELGEPDGIRVGTGEPRVLELDRVVPHLVPRLAQEPRRCPPVERGQHTVERALGRLRRQLVVLGRDPECALPLLDARISRRHARLLVANGEVRIEDIGSTNGIKVNGERLERGKPAPDVYLEAARRMDADPTACAAVEDATNGIRSADAAKMTVIVVPHPDFPPAPEALELAEEGGNITALGWALVSQSRIDSLRGRLDEAAAGLDRAEELFSQSGNAPFRFPSQLSL